MTDAHRRDDPRTVADRGTASVGAVDPHRPVVDGRGRSPKELRTDIEQLRAEPADVTAEPVHRVDVPTVPAGRVGRGTPAQLVGVALGLSLVALLVRRRRTNRSKENS